MAGILSIQFEPVLNEVKKNLEKVKNIVENFTAKNPGKPLDLMVFPEFFTTGVSHKYVDNPVDENGGKPIEFASSLAKKYKTNVIAGTVITKEGENLYNTAFALDRNGETIAKYRKIHLFKYFGGTENERITPGKSLAIVDFDFARAGLTVCFDIKYPAQYRKLAQMGAEIIVSPSAWASLKSVPNQKEQNTRAFRAMAISRAVDNIVYFVTSTQCGEAGPLANTGGSMIISPLSDILADAKEEECAIYADIDLEFVRNLQSATPIVFEE